ncbi:unnamed protein product, partial [Rotaria magnacalcarata]
FLIEEHRRENVMEPRNSLKQKKTCNGDQPDH